MCVGVWGGGVWGWVMVCMSVCEFGAKCYCHYVNSSILLKINVILVTIMFYYSERMYNGLNDLHMKIYTSL